MTEALPITIEIVGVLAILALTVYLFAFNVVRVDVAGIIVMVLIGLSSLIPGYSGLVNPERLFSGFSSNAVMSIISVMIIGAGVDRTGIMKQLATRVLRAGNRAEDRVIVILSGVAGIISSFMQNIGAVTLLLPVVNRISRQSDLAISRLLMPMGFCAILGGTITMIGSSPLILLNDLIENSNNTLENTVQIETFKLFSVFPIGVVLLLAGIGYFVYFGRFVLPEVKQKPSESGSMLKYIQEVYGITGEVYECKITSESSLVGKALSDVDAAGRAGWIVAIRTGDYTRVTPGGDSEFQVGSEVAIMGQYKSVVEFAEEYGLILKKEMDVFADVLSITNAGIAEVVIMPNSTMVGKSIKDMQIRKKYGATVLSVFRANDVIDRELSSLVMQSGDTLVIHVRWDRLVAVADARHDFAVVTDFPHENLRPEKLKYAVSFLAMTMGLILFTDIRLSQALITGAVAMILFGVIKIDEAYRAIDWQSVFLLASLISLSIAVENSGTANWIAAHVLLLFQDTSIWVLQTIIAIIATIFALLISNIGATVLLVPLAINIAIGVGADPAIFALTVALATSNSFLLPTHQVNALIMGPGGYNVSDFLKAGSIMSIMFLFIVIGMLTLFY